MSEWISVDERLPNMAKQASDFKRLKDFYVLAVDAKERMGVGYWRAASYGGYFVCAKPIGEPTHWMPLPAPPTGAGRGEVNR